MHSECYETIEALSILRKNLGADECSNIGSVLETSSVISHQSRNVSPSNDYFQPTLSELPSISLNSSMHIIETNAATTANPQLHHVNPTTENVPSNNRDAVFSRLLPIDNLNERLNAVSLSPLTSTSFITTVTFASSPVSNCISHSNSIPYLAPTAPHISNAASRQNILSSVVPTVPSISQLLYSASSANFTTVGSHSSALSPQTPIAASLPTSFAASLPMSFAPALAPTFAPGPAPTSASAPAPTFAPAHAPIFAPAHAPTFAPAHAPTFARAPAPTFAHAPSSSFASAPSASTEHYFRRLELFQPSNCPFNGEPHRFLSWVRMMQNELHNVTVNSIDTIKVLLLNTSGEPHDLIQDHFVAGAAHPDRALDKIWRSLHQRFGSNTKVTSSLLKRVDDFVEIKSANQGKRLQELLHLCELTHSYMDACHELQIFNLSQGLRKLWTKLPENLQSRWRKYGNDFEMKNFGRTPLLTDFISFLEIQTAEMCNPNYEITPENETKRKTRTSVLRTDVSSSDTNEFDNINNNFNDVCPLHERGSHTLQNCRQFNNYNYNDKRQVLRDFRRCFRCTGNHLLQRCNENVICQVCSGKHCTQLHDHEYHAMKNERKQEGSNAAPSQDFERNL